jgi:isopenicillin-N epimerase
MEKYAPIKSQFLLDPNITFLNFGSFGACPKPIFDDYQNWQLTAEREPVQFMTVKGLDHLKTSREALAQYVNCNADDLVYVPNPSYAMNLVAKSVQLNEGDEILTTNLEYGAIDMTWRYYCKKNKAKYVRQPIQLPLTTKENFLEQFWKGWTPKTKIVFIGQITSSTGLKFPVKEICETAKQKGLMTIIDGAHVPGHAPLNLSELKADIFTGACHKWMMTPKGSSFLYVKKEFQKLLDPLVISWGFEMPLPSLTPFLNYHQAQGTRDFTAFLTIPKSIQFMKENNWDKVSSDCRELARSNYQRFCDLVGSQPLCPITEEFLGQMCSIPIKTNAPEKLKQVLYEKYKIEIPVMVHENYVFLRYSINAFNSQKDLDILYDAIKNIMEETDLLNK